MIGVARLFEKIDAMAGGRSRSADSWAMLLSVSWRRGKPACEAVQRMVTFSWVSGSGTGNSRRSSCLGSTCRESRICERFGPEQRSKKRRN